MDLQLRETASYYVAAVIANTIRNAEVSKIGSDFTKLSLFGQDCHFSGGPGGMPGRSDSPQGATLHIIQTCNLGFYHV